MKLICINNIEIGILRRQTKLDLTVGKVYSAFGSLSTYLYSPRVMIFNDAGVWKEYEYELFKPVEE